jgi:cytoskeletal protein CcmA (bactofilin family)
VARRDDVLGTAGAETIIGTGVMAAGKLHSEGDITVDGTFTGELFTSGDIILGVNAVVEAELRGQNVTIAGHLIGTIEATGEATIRETGQVKGDITCHNLAVVSGGVFRGTSHMNDSVTR